METESETETETESGNVHENEGSVGSSTHDLSLHFHVFSTMICDSSLMIRDLSLRISSFLATNYEQTIVGDDRPVIVIENASSVFVYVRIVFLVFDLDLHLERRVTRADPFLSFVNGDCGYLRFRERVSRRSVTMTSLHQDAKIL